MTVSVAIMSHPKRAAMAETLCASLSASVVVSDPDPDSTHASPWRTNREALRTSPDGATHRLVLQDDVIVARNLIPTVEMIAEQFPDDLVTLYVANAPYQFRTALLWACEHGHRYTPLPTRPWVPALALLWPVSLIDPVLRFVDQQEWPPTFSADDEIIGRAMTAVGGRLFATVPSLVDHPDIVESLIGRRKNHAGRDLTRVAACFLDEDLDPLDFDWTR